MIDKSQQIVVQSRQWLSTRPMIDIIESVESTLWVTSSNGLQTTGGNGSNREWRTHTYHFYSLEPKIDKISKMDKKEK